VGKAYAVALLLDIHT